MRSMEETLPHLKPGRFVDKTHLVRLKPRGSLLHHLRWSPAR